MAQQAARKQAENPADVTGFPSARERSPRPPAGKTGVAPVGYDRCRLTFTDPDAFLKFMRGYPQREGVTFFLYRLRPRIDLSQVGLRESNIQKGGYEDLPLFTPEAVAEKFGRGHYQVKVTDSNRTDNQREVVKSCQYKLDNADKPSIYDVRSLQLAHPDNMDEVNRLLQTGELIRDAVTNAPRIRNADDGHPPAPAAAHSAGSELLDRATLGQILTGLVTRAVASPVDQFTQFLSMAKQLERPPVAAFTPDQIADLVAAKLGGSRNGDGDFFANYERVQAFIEKVRGPAGEDGGAASAPAGDGWLNALPTILNSLRGVIHEANVTFRQYAVMRGTAPPPAARPNGNGQRAAVVPIHEQQNGAPADPIEEFAMLALQKMHEGVSGYDFAAWACAWHPNGLQIFEFLEPQGATGTLGLLAMNPAANAILSDPARRPQVEQFLNDFFSFTPGGDQEGLDPDPAGEGAQRGRRRRWRLKLLQNRRCPACAKGFKVGRGGYSPARGEEFPAKKHDGGQLRILVGVSVADVLRKRSHHQIEIHQVHGLLVRLCEQRQIHTRRQRGRNHSDARFPADQEFFTDGADNRHSFLPFLKMVPMPMNKARAKNGARTENTIAAAEIRGMGSGGKRIMLAPSIRCDAVPLIRDRPSR